MTDFEQLRSVDTDDGRPRYELDESELSELTHELIASDPSDDDNRYVCYRVDSGSKFANIARHIEGKVFSEAFGEEDNSPDRMLEEYGPYDEPGLSTFFISVDKETGTATGVLRIIRNSEAGLKTLNDLEDPLKVKHPVSKEGLMEHHGMTDLDECWDIGTVAVLPEYRHSKAAAGISIQLYRAMYVSAMEEEVQHFVSIVDKKPLRQLRSYLGVPFKNLGNTKEFDYLGSKARAVYGYVPEFEKKMSGWGQYLPQRMMARSAFHALVKGSKDDAMHFFNPSDEITVYGDDYKNHAA